MLKYIAIDDSIDHGLMKLKAVFDGKEIVFGVFYNMMPSEDVAKELRGMADLIEKIPQALEQGDFPGESARIVDVAKNIDY